MGYATEATVIDHIVPHKGDPELFFDPDNLQSLCKSHHDSTKQREELGQIVGCDAMGNPPHWQQ